VNRRRVAALLRELADELEQEDDPRPATTAKKPRHIPSPEPTIPIDDVARARARKLLRRAGVAPR
jgi:hypothetical protein